jgi:hypothetical protein
MALNLNLQNTAGSIIDTYSSETIHSFLLSHGYDITQSLPPVGAPAILDWSADTLITRLSEIASETPQTAPVSVAAPIHYDGAVSALPESLKAILPTLNPRHYTRNDEAYIEVTGTMITTTAGETQDASRDEIEKLIAFFTKGQNEQALLATISA